MVAQLIRKWGSLTAVIALIVAAYSPVSAQDANNYGRTQGMQGGGSGAAQTMSLGDIARAVRAQRQNEPKAAKVIDDDNLQRDGRKISVAGGPSASLRSARPESSSGGKVILLDFWASWCGPCRQSIPDLKQLQKVFRPDQIEVVSINEDRNESAGRSFVAQNDMTWEQQFDSAGETARQYHVNAYPTFILTDQNGNVLQRFLGEDPSQTLAARIAPYMKAASRDRL